MEKGSAPVPATANAEVEVADNALLVQLAGPRNDNLRVIDREIGISSAVRGNRILLQGAAGEVALAERLIAELVDVMRAGTDIGPSDIARAARSLRDNPAVTLRDMLSDVVLVAARRRIITPKGAAQKTYIDAIRQHDIVFGIGPAGTGKTYLAMAMAVAALQNRDVKRIVLTRPAVEAGEKLGFLPGDMVEKVNPYLRPLYDALHDMLDLDRAQALIARGQIEVAPLAFMRGRTLNDSFVILDEAQNTTSEQMKMFLTRLGFASKTVITGDITQVDLPGGRKSGLLEARDLLTGIEGIQFAYFTEVDVVRHPLVQKIIRAYDGQDRSLATAAAPGGSAPTNGETSATSANGGRKS